MQQLSYMNRKFIVLILFSGCFFFTLISCRRVEKSKCKTIDLHEIQTAIENKAPRKYEISLDTLSNQNVMLTIRRDSFSDLVLERYVFNSLKNLEKYYFYNDFKKENPLLLTIELGESCLDSLSINGMAFSYRAYKTDSSDVVYVRGASPVFFNSILNLTKTGDKSENTLDTVSLGNNTWAYGVLDKNPKRIKYNFQMSFLNKNKVMFQDELLISLPLDDR